MDEGQIKRHRIPGSSTDPAPLSRLTHYFSHRYPKRKSRLSGTVFRVGEAERIQIARAFCGATTGLHVLDVGCGDGEFLANVLEGRPATLTLSDLSMDSLATARETMRAHCADIATVAGDFQSALPERQFDLVLAIGVLDYWQDWRHMLGQLAVLTSGRLLISMPPEGVPRHWLRRIWLACQGVRLQTVSRDHLHLALAEAGLDGVLLRTRYEWFACVDLDPKEVRRE
ncbi:MAG: class I SAM-dependent methyltransferase [Pseudomonadota bacterium]